MTALDQKGPVPFYGASKTGRGGRASATALFPFPFFLRCSSVSERGEEWADGWMIVWSSMRTSIDGM
jgi:hypothetical protein